jgi:hypothetical protein
LNSAEYFGIAGGWVAAHGWLMSKLAAYFKDW